MQEDDMAATRNSTVPNLQGQLCLEQSLAALTLKDHLQSYGLAQFAKNFEEVGLHDLSSLQSLQESQRLDLLDALPIDPCQRLRLLLALEAPNRHQHDAQAAVGGRARKTFEMPDPASSESASASSLLGASNCPSTSSTSMYAGFGEERRFPEYAIERLRQIRESLRISEPKGLPERRRCLQHGSGKFDAAAEVEVINASTPRTADVMAQFPPGWHEEQQRKEKKDEEKSSACLQPLRCRNS
jgi:hypothetical protein